MRAFSTSSRSLQGPERRIGSGAVQGLQYVNLFGVVLFAPRVPILRRDGFLLRNAEFSLSKNYAMMVFGRVGILYVSTSLVTELSLYGVCSPGWPARALREARSPSSDESPIVATVVVVNGWAATFGSVGLNPLGR